jgi:hypothetical protein
MDVDFVTVTFEHTSALPRDRIVNTWVFGENTGGHFDATKYTAIEDALSGFYNFNGTYTRLSADLSSVLSRSAAPTVRHYDVTTHLDGSDAGSPLRIGFLDLLGAPGTGTYSGLNLPAEVATCLSFHSAYGSDVEFGVGSRPRARDRGRVYIGPLNGASINIEGTTHRAIVGTEIRDALIHAAQAMRAALAPDILWCTWSRKAARVGPVTHCSVDDAFDTQRRRGERALSAVGLDLP